MSECRINKRKTAFAADVFALGTKLHIHKKEITGKEDAKVGNFKLKTGVDKERSRKREKQPNLLICLTAPA